MPSLGVIPANIAISDISPETRLHFLQYISVIESIFNHIYVMGPESYRVSSAKERKLHGHYAI